MKSEEETAAHEQSVRARAEELAIERDARQRLATENWHAPPLLDWNTLEAKETHYLLDGYLERGTVGTLVGRYGLGKSFIAVDWCACIAMGREWHGHEVDTGKANILYVAAEGAQGMGRRRLAWEQYHDTKMDVEGFSFITAPVPLATAKGEAFLVEQIRKLDIDLLVIDTLARSIPGLNENDAQDMGLVIDTLFRLRDAIAHQGTTVLVIHHHGKDTSRGARGSSRLTDDMDFCFELREDKDPAKPYQLVCAKMKDDEQPKPFLYRLHIVDIDGKMSSCVIQPDHTATASYATGKNTRGTCAYCGEYFIKSRADQKFCDDVCRNRNHRNPVRATDSATDNPDERQESSPPSAGREAGSGSLPDVSSRGNRRAVGTRISHKSKGSGYVRL